VRGEGTGDEVEMKRGKDLEWLVSDAQGAFAMGTASGLRTRKYHGFYLGIPGRSQTAYLTDLDFECQGISIWPHLYLSPQGPIQNPEPEVLGFKSVFHDSPQGPSWRWNLPQGELIFRVLPARPAGIAVHWEWAAQSKEATRLKVRGFWAMRDLHALGGRIWNWQRLDSIRNSGIQGTLVHPESGQEGYCFFRGAWEWVGDPLWFQNFYYPIEIERGYQGYESLYSAGFFEIQLQPGESCDWVSSIDPGVFDLCESGADVTREPQRWSFSSSRSRIFDFQLKSPAGIVAGFPWFGEWGRDTFVSLPGLAAVWIESETTSHPLRESASWIGELMERWGKWILSDGRLPNLLEKDGKIQWESCDATLWWCHSLASLWSYTKVHSEFYPSLRSQFFPLLNAAIDSIRRGLHPYLRVLESGLIEVTGSRTSWMDAQVGGKSVTPRLGLLPEVNALWFQALTLQQIWTEGGSVGQRVAQLKILAEAVLNCRESSRPNFVFLHSIPLAPSFVFPEFGGILEADVTHLYEQFWTPVGLRTLVPSDSKFQPRYLDHPTERDAAYHQGPAWAWLGGQFEVARDRLSRTRSSKLSRAQDSAVLRAKTLPPTTLNEMPILGHIAELFDSLTPFTARGAPAQAWSLACWEEAQARRRWQMDQKIEKIWADDSNQGSSR